MHIFTRPIESEIQKKLREKRTNNMIIIKRAKTILTSLTAGLLLTSFSFARAEMNVEAPSTIIESNEGNEEPVKFLLNEPKVIEAPKVIEVQSYGYLEIAVDSLNIRSTPDLTKAPVGAYTKGTLVIAHAKTSNNWYKLSSGKYISAKYVKVRTDITSYEQFLAIREATIKAEQERKAAQLAAQEAANKKQQQQVAVSTSGTSAYKSISMTSAERDLLAKLIKAEAGGESFNGQVAVAKVVLNRVKDSRFPNTVKGVIYAKNQFTPVSSGKINRVSATSTQYSAIDTALKSNDNLGGAIYFYAPSLVKSSWFESLKTVAVIGVHEFKVN